MTISFAPLLLLPLFLPVLLAPDGAPAPSAAPAPETWTGVPRVTVAAAPVWPAPAPLATPVPLATAARVPGSAATGLAPAGGVWPLDPVPLVVAGFDPPVTPYGAGHRGVDLAGRPGQEVRAAAAGRVTFAGRLAGRGVVVVSHGATRTTYLPVRASVPVGSWVEAGTDLGTLEAFGGHCPPAACLHWGLLEGDVYLDPLTLVGAGPVRLLPQAGHRPTSRAGSGPGQARGWAWR